MNYNKQKNIKFINAFSIDKFLTSNINIIYPFLFYFSGLLLGSFLYELLDNSIIIHIVKNIWQGSSEEFLTILQNKVIIYFSLFILTALLSLNLIGFFIVNIIPLISGFDIAIRLSYYYVNFGPKGIGYALLIIIPGAVLFISVLLYTIEIGSILSRYIFNVISKKADIIDDFNLKLYLLKFLIYGFIVIIIALFSSLSNYLFSSLISL